jgi:hypothetical protein
VTYVPPAVTVSQVITIMIEVSDGQGGLDIGTVDVTVDPAPGASTVNFQPVADSWVNARKPDKNYGSSTELKVDARPVRISYLRFSVGGLTAPIQSARIRLTVTNQSSSGGTIHSVSDVGWSELGLTYNNRPVIDGPASDTLGPVSVGEVVEFDVTSAVTQNGEYSFAIVGVTNNRVGYSAREAATGAPTLVITVQAAP